MTEKNENAKISKKTFAAVETGHAKTVANFERLTLFVAGYGASYNPSINTIKLAAMQSTLASAKLAIGMVHSSISFNKNAVAAREEVFAGLAKLLPRISCSVNATSASQSVKDKVKTVIRKIQGKRAKAKKTEEELDALKVEGKETKNISASQMSYDNRLDNFEKLITMLTNIPEYAPNELDLKVSGLTTFCKELRDKHLVAEKTLVPLSNARISRDKTLYNGNANIVAIASDCKLYIKSAFGPTSREYKQVSKLQFRNRA